ncbi:class I adenylate-forming enzyme family protein [Jiella pacifica]|uniref:AMP-binding protein n=1 Tax=Jiella pacifica TaxID=2696469 RepID=A0A6N9T8I8_9HYPH|nr:class I adenylate-forming enzyme family protein [Jiella pacifica]NDW06019.1 AMP-binding protein [Jiella pacifica]
MSASIHDVFAESCKRHSKRTAIVDMAGAISYGDLLDAATALGGFLRTSLPKGCDRVAIHAENSAKYVAGYYGALAVGLTPFLLDPALGRRDLATISQSCGVGPFLHDAKGSAALRDAERLGEFGGLTLGLVGGEVGGAAIPALDPRTGTCRFTSGTTGAPKCLEFSHLAVTSAARNWIEGTGLAGDDRVLCLATFANGLAFNTSLLASFIQGAELHLHEGMPTSARIRARVEGAKITRLVGFPLLYQILGGSSEEARGESSNSRLASLRVAISAGAPLAAEVRARFEATSGVLLADYYGIAEVGPCTFAREGHDRGLGGALPGVEIEAPGADAEPGEIRVRTASMATRYLNAPDALGQRLNRRGFYRTGDLGRLDEGCLFVTGRIEGPINLAGRKVDPVEIESFARTLPGVEDAAVFADTDAAGGTFIHLAVAGSSALLPRAIQDACRRELTPYKVPARVSPVPTIPRSSSGKARQTLLRELIAAGRDDKSSNTENA